MRANRPLRSPLRRLYVLAVVLLAAASSEPAAAGVWSNLGTFSNSSGAALAGDPSDPLVLYAGMSSDGVYKTSDGGANWTPANTGLTSPFILSLLVDPATPTTVYVGTNGDGVFKSTDGALSWSAANTGLGDLNGFDMEMDPSDPLTIYVATFVGVFKSVDGAATWSAASTGLTTLFVQSLAMDPSSPMTLYAATSGGVFKTTNGGALWVASNTGLPSLFANDLAIDPNTPSTIFVGLGTTPSLHKSIDGGATWSNSSFGLTSVVFSIAVDPTVPGRVWAGMGSGLHRSGDGGATWTLGSIGMADPSNTAQATVVVPGTPTNTYAGVSSCCGHGPVYRLVAFCGDGAIDSGEECDDGNQDGGDGCDASCQLEACFSCGAGEPTLCVPDDGASCDDGNDCTTADECSAGACVGAPVVCSACEGCSGGICAPAPRVSCAQSTVVGKSKLLIKDHDVDGKDKMLWKWSKGAAVLVGDLGDPTVDTDYTLCIYDGVGAIASRAEIPAAGTCDVKPCWKKSGASGYVYTDKAAAADGVLKLKIKAGADGKAKAKVKGKGEAVDMPNMTALSLPLLVQLQGDEPATCVEATFSSSGVIKSTDSQFVGVSD